VAKCKVAYISPKERHRWWDPALVVALNELVDKLIRGVEGIERCKVVLDDGTEDEGRS
jgi:hypothetical protein